MPRRKRTKKPIKKKVVKVEKKIEPTYLGEGSVSGEYLFAEIPGSVTAESLEVAIEKAKRIIDARPDLDYIN